MINGAPATPRSSVVTRSLTTVLRLLAGAALARSVAIAVVAPGIMVGEVTLQVLR